MLFLVSVVVVQSIEHSAVKYNATVGCSVVDAVQWNSVEKWGCSAVTCSAVVVVQCTEYSAME